MDIFESLKSAVYISHDMYVLKKRLARASELLNFCICDDVDMDEDAADGVTVGMVFKKDVEIFLEEIKKDVEIFLELIK